MRINCVFRCESRLEKIVDLTKTKPWSIFEVKLDDDNGHTLFYLPNNDPENLIKNENIMFASSHFNLSATNSLKCFLVEEADICPIAESVCFVGFVDGKSHLSMRDYVRSTVRVFQRYFQRQTDIYNDEVNNPTKITDDYQNEFFHVDVHWEEDDFVYYELNTSRIFDCETEEQNAMRKDLDEICEKVMEWIEKNNVCEDMICEDYKETIKEHERRDNMSKRAMCSTKGELETRENTVISENKPKEKLSFSTMQPLPKFPPPSLSMFSFLESTPQLNRGKTDNVNLSISNVTTRPKKPNPISSLLSQSEVQKWQHSESSSRGKLMVEKARKDKCLYTKSKPVNARVQFHVQKVAQTIKNTFARVSKTPDSISKMISNKVPEVHFDIDDDEDEEEDCRIIEDANNNDKNKNNITSNPSRKKLYSDLGGKTDDNENPVPKKFFKSAKPGSKYNPSEVSFKPEKSKSGRHYLN
jgi:hypothetical protein